MRDTNRWKQSVRQELAHAMAPLAAMAQAATAGTPQLATERGTSSRAPSRNRAHRAIGPDDILDVELGLAALEVLAPGERAEAFYTLLRGYPVGRIAAPARDWTREQRQALGVARQLLAHVKSAYAWRAALERYRRVDEQLRGFTVAADLGQYARRPVSVLARRFELYMRTLGKAPPYTRRALAPGPLEGSYAFREGSRMYSFRAPARLPALPTARGHELGGTARRAPLRVTVQELLETARWMDETLDRGYARVIEGLRMRLFNAERTELELSQTLTIDEVTHLVGMLGAGKSTLMETLAVWAARRGLRVTLVLGDVMGALDRLDRFTRLGLAAAPILGASNRARHLRQLRRAQAARRSVTEADLGVGVASPLARDRLDHAGYRALATACPLDALTSDERQRPFELGREPCRTLRWLPPRGGSRRAAGVEEVAGQEVEEGWEHKEEHETDDTDAAADAGGEPVGCPLYLGCPRRQTERGLVEARIWLATPASLIYTGVPPELNAERLRMAELVFRSTDLVIVDEADAVQVQLDNMFCPTQALTGDADGGDAWLDALNSHLATLRPRQTPSGAQRAPAEWSHALHTAMIVTEQIYALLQDPQTSPYLDREWASYEYFSEWSLFHRRLARELAGLAAPIGDHPWPLDGAAAATEEQQASMEHFARLFDAFTDDHLGELADVVTPDPTTLAAVARVLLANNNADRQYQAIEAWIEAQGAHARFPSEAHDAIVTRLRFALLVALLSKQLTYLTGTWRQVEGALLLDHATLGPLQRPPADFTAVLPDAPMGNILGYQFLPGRDGAPGSLRFLRCQGVGRALLLRFATLFEMDGLAGPHTLLLSGTSWAGASPSYHVLAPIAGVLDMREEEREALRQSVFVFQPYPRRDDPSRSIAVSGLYGAERDRALGELLDRLAMPDAFQGPSLLERERDRLPQGRRRLLLVVGSYHEAHESYQRLIALRPEWAGRATAYGQGTSGAGGAANEPQVAYLTPDDHPEDDDDQTPSSRVLERIKKRAGALPRGRVARLSETNAWILIAPLKAIERGHNILNEYDQAALGAVYFLVRPHERPDDISFAIHTMNRFAMEALDPAEPDAGDSSGGSWRQLDLTRAGGAFSQEAYRHWHRLLRRQLSYTTAQPQEREALVWNQLVPIWQVIGRLVRGGTPARVYFCDARFAPMRADNAERRDTAATSLLVAMRGVLHPYLAEPEIGEDAERAGELACLISGLPHRAGRDVPPDARALARALYEPLYAALRAVKGL